MTTLVEGTHPGGFLVWEAFRDYTRETITVAAGTHQGNAVRNAAVQHRNIIHIRNGANKRQTA